MKRYVPYIIGGVGFIVLLALLLLAKRSPQRLDERITLKQGDKIPYGLFAARNLLPSLFPQAAITTDDEAPGMWQGINVDSSGQAVFIAAPSIYASKKELDDLVYFIQKGNYVFLTAAYLNDEVEDYFKLSSSNDFYIDDPADRLSISLSAPRFAKVNFSYPGRNLSKHFQEIDSAKMIVLGQNKKGQPNFVQLNSFTGSIFLHVSPLAFSNYFLLYKNNVAYYEQALSVIPSTVKKIVWNEYYLRRTNQPKQSDKEPNWLRVLFRYESFKWALLTAIALIGLYLLSEMRRRQRYIPEYVKPKNESLDFVKTIGRLYYDKRDHRDLALKMAQYFMDHVRHQYKLSTTILDKSFVKALSAKTGYDQVQLNEIVGFIQYLRDSDTITEAQLAHFYKQLETFYQTT